MEWREFFFCGPQKSPRTFLIILQKLSTQMIPRNETRENRIQTTSCSINDVEWWRKMLSQSCRDFSRVFFRNPTCVNRILSKDCEKISKFFVFCFFFFFFFYHVDAVTHVITCTRSRHHVQRCFRHVRLWMRRSFEDAVKLSLLFVDGGKLCYCCFFFFPPNFFFTIAETFTMCRSKR